MELRPEFTLRATLGQTLQMNGGPFGARIATSVSRGSVKGDRISGDLIGPGADWAIVGTDGYAHVDVRTQIRTDDGADLFMYYTGSIELSEVAFTALLGDGETGFDDQYFRTHVRLESGDDRYTWVNRSLFVGQGRVTTDGVEYEVFRVL